MKWARVHVQECEIGFGTDCGAAFDYLASMSKLFNIADYRFVPAEGPLSLPTIRYHDALTNELHFEDGRPPGLYLTGRWQRLRGSTMLRVTLLLMCEVQRQRAGRYLLHGSAVTREGRGILFVGPSGAGKTIAALDLCLRHGCKFFANDQVVVGDVEGVPSLLYGDGLVNLRRATLARYDSSLAARFFRDDADRPSATPWSDKVCVEPGAIGLTRAPAGSPAPIAALLLPRLDAFATHPEVAGLKSGNVDTTFQIKSMLYQEMSTFLRGASIVPFDRQLALTDLVIPSCDTRETASRRASFLNRVFDRCEVSMVRGDLELLARTALASGELA